MVGAGAEAAQPWSNFEAVPLIQGQRRIPRKMAGGGKSCLKSNTIPARDAQRAQTKPHVHRDPGIPQETEPDPPLSF